jgi:hypothetical protein
MTKPTRASACLRYRFHVHRADSPQHDRAYAVARELMKRLVRRRQEPRTDLSLADLAIHGFHQLVPEDQLIGRFGSAQFAVAKRNNLGGSSPRQVMAP